ncbi:MAG: Gfo/Idh/MocA family oxidoreductase [Gemmatales bacterium]|nr:Gfo/Idh/MocA family oxidoreductase [Gemmatales bacterium]MDW8387813.1 Gfo/Idh/MocA family oxidoreductase [Gemmatales bacterium]
MPRLRMAVIGVGHLGKEHARILSSFSDVELIGVADVNLEQARMVAARCQTQAYGDFRRLIPLVDAVTIAVPTSLHHAVASEFLRRGISCMVEKPLAATLEEADELLAMAERTGAVLQVGHIERFNPVVLELERHRFQPKFIEGHRLGAFTGRSLDIGVVLDLMIHDLDLVTTLVGSPITSIQALGVSLVGPHEDLAHARLTFANGCLANLSASRVSPKASRRMRFYAPEGYVSIDFQQRKAVFVQPTEAARQFREEILARGLDPARLARLKEGLYGRYLQVREIDMQAVDQLTLELADFVRCVQTGSTPKVSGHQGRDAVALASRILDHIRRHAWDGNAFGAVGPEQLPAALGRFFDELPETGELAA